MAEESSKPVDNIQHQSTTALPADQFQTITVQDEPKPTTTEGTDVAAPATTSVIPNDTPAQTGPTMGVRFHFRHTRLSNIATGTLRH